MTETVSHAANTMWIVCSGCGEMLYVKRLERSFDVCPECGWHAPLPAWRRIELLLDPGSAEPLVEQVPIQDPLEFTDLRPYPDRLSAARASTGLSEAVVCVRGTIGGTPVIVAVMDFRFLGGSLGASVGELITRAAETALRTRTSLLLVTASGGARMQEGVISLMQMAKTAQALAQLDRAGILTVSLITDPTFGGVAASYATLCDVLVAEPGARLGFAGPRVIAQTLRQPLPEGFQSAELLLERGMIDVIRPRDRLRSTLGQLLAAGAGRQNQHVQERVFADLIVRDPDALAVPDAWMALRRARDVRRPSTLDYIDGIVDGFVELRGDRVSGDCPAIVGGVGRIGCLPVMVIGHQKGHTAAALAERNFGMAIPAGYRKAARLMRFAGKLGLPVVTFVDTPGAYPGPEAEKCGQANAIAENLRLMAQLPVPIVSVILGEGGSGGALALAVANRVLICENAVYSVISPEGCAAILWKDAGKARAATAALRITAADLLRMSVVDGVIREPANGNRHNDPATRDRMRAAVLGALGELLALDAAQLVADRHNRFRAFGVGEVAAVSRRTGVGV
ncbi:MAG: acetyl-CoA carboxylase carboxyl transferase subunit alpha [Pseudonocardiaceae bacterium]